MIHAQNTKMVLLTPPAAQVDDATVTIAELDTIGWEYCQFVFVFGDMPGDVTAMSITESDTSTSGHVAINGLDFDDDTNIAGDASALPYQSDNTFWIGEIDLKYRKRYLDATLTIDNAESGVYLTVFAILSRAKDHPVTAAERGCAEILRV